MTKEEIKKLQEFALQIRIGTVECIKSRGFGHIGGSLSVADVLAVLYGGVMNIDPKDPAKADRDKLVCSKGHAGPAVYATLALKGYFPYEKLMTLNRPGTDLPSHCDKNKTTGVDMTTGSLGQGTSTAVGLALGDMPLSDCMEMRATVTPRSCPPTPRALRASSAQVHLTSPHTYQIQPYSIASARKSLKALLHA